MRQIGTIEDPKQAGRFVDHLLSLKIDSKIMAGPEGPVVWVIDENKLETARTVLAEFRANPDDPKYHASKLDAARVRRDEARAERAFRKQVRHIDERSTVREWKRRPITTALVVASVAISLWTNFGRDPRSFFALSFDSFHFDPFRGFVPDDPTGLGRLGKGEIWRLITPIFVHMNGFHLLFNMGATLSFGRVIEDRKGKLKLAILVLASAALSNYAQHAWMIHSDGHVGLFGGMSGVVYAFFGYLWGKTVFDLGDGIVINRQSVNMMMLWLVLCMSGTLGPIANAAHVGGLVVGLIFGFMRF